MHVILTPGQRPRFVSIVYTNKQNKHIVYPKQTTQILEISIIMIFTVTLDQIVSAITTYRSNLETDLHSFVFTILHTSILLSSHSVSYS